MTEEETIGIENLLNELLQYEYPQTKQRTIRLKELLTPWLEAEKRKHYRARNSLKSSVDRDIVKEVIKAQTIFNGINTMYRRAYDEVGYHDNATNDLLHALELLEDDEELIDYTRQLRDTRKMRREAKDFQEVVKPMVNFMNRNRKVIKEFNEAVEEMRMADTRQENRSYTPRVKTEMELAFEKAAQQTEEREG